MAKHSSIVGGSTAKRVINCPASVALVAKMPPKPSSKYADEGTLCHNVIAEILEKDLRPEDTIGMKYKTHVMTQELLERKIWPALMRLNEVDPDFQMEYMVESEVDFGDYIEGAFGSADLLGKTARKAIVLDWKFGDGVIVEAEENDQAMFYACAAMRTPKCQWIFDDVDEVEVIIIQPPEIRRWTTTIDRLKQFERELRVAVKESQKPDAPMASGSHCRWCAAKPTCPLMTGAVDRATQLALKDLEPSKIAHYLAQADVIEQWVTDLRSLAHQMLEADIRVPGYKLVAKRATRQWSDAALANGESLLNYTLGLGSDVLYTKKIISPAQAEKLLKAKKKELPKELVVAISSGSTLVEDSDPRPAVLQIGRQLSAVLSKLN